MNIPMPALRIGTSLIMLLSLFIPWIEPQLSVNQLIDHRTLNGFNVLINYSSFLIFIPAICILFYIVSTGLKGLGVKIKNTIALFLICVLGFAVILILIYIESSGSFPEGHFGFVLFIVGLGASLVTEIIDQFDSSLVKK